MGNDDSSVNYIKHLCTIHILFTDDNRLTPSHISLYMAVFQMWNISRFSPSLLIIRSELMQISKVRSKSTYHRTIKELHDFGYLEYFPSRNPHVGSKLKMLTIDQILALQNSIGRSNTGHQMGHYCPNTGQDSPISGHLNEPLYKHINNYKHINLFMSQNEFCNPIKEEQIFKISSSKKEVSNAKFSPPCLEQILNYFLEKNKPKIEAEKFFNYFESKGWKIGNRSPMKNWKAAANNWMINFDKYNHPRYKPPPDNLHTETDKDYSIPL